MDLLLSLEGCGTDPRLAIERLRYQPVKAAGLDWQKLYRAASHFRPEEASPLEAVVPE